MPTKTKTIPGELSIVHGKPLDEAGGPEAQTIAGFAREITSRWAKHEALVMYAATDAIRWTYADLWERSMAVARALVANGVGKGTRVGILMSNRPEYIASVFGIALAGGVTVTLNTFSTPNELDYLLKASEVELLIFEPRIVNKDFGAMLAEMEPAITAAGPGKLLSQRFPFLRRLVALGTGAGAKLAGVENWVDFLSAGDEIPCSVVEARVATLAPSDTATLFFSSGSTGLPKGILHNQRAVVLQWRRWPDAVGFTGAIRAWTANGFFWSGNFAMVIGSALSTGGAIVLQSGFDAEEALELMQKEHVNTPFAMPHQWGRIASAPGFEQADLSALCWFDPQFWGVQNPTIPLSYRQPQAFGSTETLTINTSAFFGEGSSETRYEGHGLPLPGNTLKIVDPLTGEVVPLGERGEIAVKGATLMTGYLGKTAEECFDEGGFYHSGDGGYFDETGWLFWEGRLNDIIKTGGANVSPLEVDEALKNYPGVKTTQTVGVPHDTLGEMVVSCIVPTQRNTFDVAALREFLKERLASYKLPRRILVLSDDELSVTGSGNKIKATEVRELATARLAAEKAGESA